MMTLLAMPPGDVSSCAVIRLVIGLGLTGVPGGLVGVETEAAILLVVGPGLTSAWMAKEVEGLVVVVPGD